MQPSKCPQCGKDVPADAPGGTCPDCLLSMGLGGDTATTVGATARRSTPSAEEMNRHFPNLDILSIVGQGGMGIVYKARQTHLDRIVALKVIPREWSAGPEFHERFTREARTMAKLDHPHIVRVHEFGETDGLHFLVMEFVDGSNLRQLMQSGELEPAAALAIVPQVCEALQYAHDRGVVHRDIKPENVLIDRDGKVKIADFGLAKLVQNGAADFTLTGAGQVMGTLHYMAPEQYRTPKDVDHRADLFSLGVVFYEMLTGELPVGRFDSPSAHQNVDARLDRVVLRALERERERRYQQAQELRTDLDAISSFAWDRDVVEEFEVVDDPPAPRRRDHERQVFSGTQRTSRLAVIGALGVPLALVLGFLTYWFVARFTIYDDGDHIGAGVGALVGLGVMGAGFVLSIIAWIVVGSSDRLKGLGLAIFGTLFPVFAFFPMSFFMLSASIDSPRMERSEFGTYPRDAFMDEPILEAPLAPSPHPEQPFFDAVNALWGRFQAASKAGADFELWLTEEDRLRMRTARDEDLASMKEMRRLGLLFSDLGELPAPIHDYEVREIEREEAGHRARVTVTYGSSVVSFPIERHEGHWWFTLGPVDVK